MEQGQSSSQSNSEMEQGQASNQSNSTRGETGTPSQICRALLDLSTEIDEIIGSEQLFFASQCSNFKLLLDFTAKWIDRFESKTNSSCPVAMEKKLLGVLERGMRLVRKSADQNPVKLELLFIILGSADELSEIFEDARRYCRMIVQCSPGGEVRHIKFLLSEIEKEWRQWQGSFTVNVAYEQDKQAVIEFLKSAEQQLLPNSGIAGLISMLEAGIAPLIAEHDLSITDESLGGGCFGIVKKAFWCNDIPVAIKEFHYDDYFEDEYKVCMKLLGIKSPHIVRTFGRSELGNGQDKRKNVLVMEVMDTDLEKLIKTRKKIGKDRPFSVDESVDIMLQIVMGMRSLHRHNVIYRDLKPTNILIKERDDRSLIVKLSDFGASRAEFWSEIGPHTANRGTERYMAPEMADAGGIYTRKVDVYSFGLVCTEILTGRKPELIRDRMQQNQIHSLPQYVPRNLCTIIWRCLHQEAHKRPSFAEIFDRLWDVKESALMAETQIGESKSKEINDPTCKKAIYWYPKYGWELLPTVDRLEDIVVGPLGITSSGQLEILREVHLIGPHSFQSDLGVTFAQAKIAFASAAEELLDVSKKLNVSLMIGGWDNSRFFSDAFSSYENRTSFTNSVLQFCRFYPIFDGLVIDWMYLSDDGINYGKEGNIVRSEDGENFVLVLEQLRSALPPAFLITVTCDRTEARWPIERAVHLIDQIFLRNSSSGQETAHHTANLYSTSHQRWSMDESIKYYVSKGIHSSRIYIEAAREPVGFSNADDIGKTATRGIPSDLQVSCFSELIDVGFVEKWDDEAKAPYAYHPTRRVVCVYDNIRSIKEKAHYVKTKNLGGIFIGHCPADQRACKMFAVAHDNLKGRVKQD